MQWRDWATKKGSKAMQPEAIMVTGDDEAGWFFHHPELGKNGPLPTLQAALGEAVQLAVKHDVGVSFQMVDGTEKRYWAVGEPLPAPTVTKIRNRTQWRKPRSRVRRR